MILFNIYWVNMVVCVERLVRYMTEVAFAVYRLSRSMEVAHATGWSSVRTASQSVGGIVSGPFRTLPNRIRESSGLLLWNSSYISGVGPKNLLRWICREKRLCLGY